MEDPIQVPRQVQSEPQAPVSFAGHLTVEPKPKGKIWQIVGLAALIVVAILALLEWYGSSTGNQETSAPAVTQSNTKSMGTTISFLGNTYTKGFTFPASTGTDYTSESYEWVKGAETVDNWQTLITTHKLTPLSPDKPLSAEAYAQNVAALNSGKGAVIVETSVINTADAAAKGVDISNPPYVLVYIYPSADGTAPAELAIQKIENLGEGKVGAFIYGERLTATSSEEINASFRSPAYIHDRLEVILSKFPY